jgi:hypothetical protein
MTYGEGHVSEQTRSRASVEAYQAQLLDDVHRAPLDGVWTSLDGFALHLQPDLDN